MSSAEETLVYIPHSNQADDYTEYTVEIHHCGYTWEVKHRYSEFKALHDAVRLKHPHVEKSLLPPKKIFGKMSPAFIDKRRGELETYLQTLLKMKFKNGLPLPLRKFLHFNFYDIEMICQTLSERLFRIGDGILNSGSSYTFNTLDLWAISERISMKKPSTDNENPSYDFGHLLDFVYNLKYLHVVCVRGNVGTSNIKAEDLIFDIAIFRSLSQLVADGCSCDQAKSFVKLHRSLTSLSVHNSLDSISSILTGGYDELDSDMGWKNLVTADFSDNDISRIDDTVKLMTCVEFLDLSRNKISKIENLHFLASLTFIDLSHNMISEFECAHAKMGNVKSLILASNKLKNLHGLEKLYALENLNVSDNLITELDEVDHVSRLPCIVRLNLSKNAVINELDYRTRALSKFGTRAFEICLDETPSSQKELDTAAVLHAMFKSKRNSCCGSPLSGSYRSGKSAPIDIQRKKVFETPVFSAPGRFYATPEVIGVQKKQTDNESGSLPSEHSRKRLQMHSVIENGSVVTEKTVLNEQKDEFDKQTSLLSVQNRDTSTFPSVQDETKVLPNARNDDSRAFAETSDELAPHGSLGNSPHGAHKDESLALHGTAVNAEKADAPNQLVHAQTVSTLQEIAYASVPRSELDSLVEHDISLLDTNLVLDDETERSTPESKSDDIGSLTTTDENSFILSDDDELETSPANNKSADNPPFAAESTISPLPNFEEYEVQLLPSKNVEISTLQSGDTVANAAELQAHERMSGHVLDAMPIAEELCTETEGNYETTQKVGSNTETVSAEEDSSSVVTNISAEKCEELNAEKGISSTDIMIKPSRTEAELEPPLEYHKDQPDTIHMLKGIESSGFSDGSEDITVEEATCKLEFTESDEAEIVEKENAEINSDLLQKAETNNESFFDAIAEPNSLAVVANIENEESLSFSVLTGFPNEVSSKEEPPTSKTDSNKDVDVALQDKNRLRCSCEDIASFKSDVLDETEKLRSFSVGAKTIVNKLSLFDTLEGRMQCQKTNDLKFVEEHSQSNAKTQRNVSADPMMNLSFSSAPLLHLSSLVPSQLANFKLACMSNDEQIEYVTWSHVVFYAQPLQETACAVFLTNAAVYFLPDAVPNTTSSFSFADFQAIVAINESSVLRVEFSNIVQLVVGLFCQYVRITGSNPTHTVSLVTRSSYISTRFVNNLISLLEVSNTEMLDVQKLLSRSTNREDVSVSLQRGIKAVLQNERSMMEFNLTTLELQKPKESNIKASQFVLYLLIHSDEKGRLVPKSLLLSSQVCCLCDENLVSYPIPDFEMSPPLHERFQNLQLFSLADISLLEVDKLVGHTVTIKSHFTAWTLSFRDYTERNKLLRALCEQYELLKGSSLTIHCAK